MPRKASIDTMPISVRLPKKWIDHLGRSELGVSEEIRRRIERTLEQDEFDPHTRELCDDIMSMAEEINHYSVGEADWHANIKSHEAVKVAIGAWLDMIKPPDPDGVALADLPGPKDPETLGRATAKFRLKAKRYFSDRPEARERSDALTRRSHKLVRANKGKPL